MFLRVDDEELRNFGFFSVDIVKCAAIGDIEGIRNILSEDPSQLNARDPKFFGRTAVMQAVGSEQVETAKFLLSQSGIDLTVTDDFGADVLFYAMEEEPNTGKELNPEFSDLFFIIHEMLNPGTWLSDEDIPQGPGPG